MPPTLVLVLASAILLTTIAYWVGWWTRDRDAYHDQRDLAAIHQAELDVAFQRGREYEREVLTRHARFTTTSPELN
jgi:hypothetical protein